jgi:rfaE bifunctional protein nucleotidyltransferase chain/domain
MPAFLKKIIDNKDLNEWSKTWHAANKKIVFTNGCFDILHRGHVLYLAEAKSYGDILLVAINSDLSVKRLKGPERPIHDEKSRAIVLSALESVDAVILFEEDTPLSIIEQCQPDILVKGGDWTVEEIVGSDFVIKHGGQVFSLRYHEGFSTTLTEEKIKTRLT